MVEFGLSEPPSDFNREEWASEIVQMTAGTIQALETMTSEEFQEALEEVAHGILAHPQPEGTPAPDEDTDGEQFSEVAPDTDATNTVAPRRKRKNK